jgi:hypothetical protein
VIDDEVAPLLQTYDDPPLAVNVVDEPAQIEDNEAPTLMLGDALTVIVLVTTDAQPALLVPVHE